MKQLIYVTLIFVLFACSEDDFDDATTSDGTLTWMGSPAVDGCGLILEIDTTSYFVSSEKNTFIQFHEDDSLGIKVIARYTVLKNEIIYGSWGCEALRKAKILDIVRR